MTKLWRRGRWLHRRRSYRDNPEHIMITASADAVLGIDTQGVCVTANPACRRIFDCPPERLIGMPAHGLVPQLTQLVRQAAAGYRDSGSPQQTTVARWDGRVAPVIVRLYPVANGPIAVYATIRDHTEHAAAHQALQTLRQELSTTRWALSTCASAVDDRAVLVTDVHGHITLFNTAAEKLLGYRDYDVLGRPWSTLSDPSDLIVIRDGVPEGTDLDPFIYHLAMVEHAEQNWTFISRDGEPVVTRMNAAIVGTAAEPAGLVVVAQAAEAPWDPLSPYTRSRSTTIGDRLLLDLDDVESRSTWQTSASRG